MFELRLLSPFPLLVTCHSLQQGTQGSISPPYTAEELSSWEHQDVSISYLALSLLFLKLRPGQVEKWGLPSSASILFTEQKFYLRCENTRTLITPALSCEAIAQCQERQAKRTSDCHPTLYQDSASRVGLLLREKDQRFYVWGEGGMQEEESGHKNNST